MKEKSLTFASIVTAGVASVCCIGPMLAVGLGLGTFGWALSEELRPWLLGGSGLLLAGAFYLTYRRRPEAECADGACAVSPEKTRKRKMLLWLATAAVAALAAFPHYSAVMWGESMSANDAPALAMNDAAAAMAMETNDAADTAALAAGDSNGKAVALFSIDGMTCAACATGVRAALQRQKGVRLAEVDYENATARIQFDHSQTSAAKLIDAIGQLGFKAELQEPRS